MGSFSIIFQELSSSILHQMNQKDQEIIKSQMKSQSKKRMPSHSSLGDMHAAVGDYTY